MPVVALEMLTEGRSAQDLPKQLRAKKQILWFAGMPILDPMGDGPIPDIFFPLHYGPGCYNTRIYS